VGIGTSSPAFKLDIVASANASLVSRVLNTNTGASTQSILQLGTGASAERYSNLNVNYTSQYFQNVGVNISTLYQDYDTQIFRKNDGTERARITSAGRMQINTTAVTNAFLNVVSGTFDPTVNSWASNAAICATGQFGGGLLFLDGGAGYAVWSEDAGKDFYIRGNTIGTSLTGGVFLNNYATSWSAASDENIKDIIEPITNAVKKVVSLRTVIGKYKDEAEGTRHPFLIAQDVQAVLPEAVSLMNKGGEKECLALSYTDTIPLLVAAVKEQQQMIETLQAKVAALEAQ
jgi:hypothetical protein